MKKKPKNGQMAEDSSITELRRQHFELCNRVLEVDRRLKMVAKILDELKERG